MCIRDRYEELIYDEDGNILNGTFMDYLVPTAVESPKWETGHTVTPSPHHPIGAKGVGESPTVGAPPAIANAIVDALSHLGVEHLDIPITPYKVWKVLQDLKSKDSSSNGSSSTSKSTGSSGAGSGTAVAAGAAVAASATAASSGSSTTASDLTKVEGIGPKIAGILNAAGIHTFEDLANTHYEDTKRILTEAGSKFASHDPTTWAGQAHLAAQGKWAELKKWQDELDGGRE